VAVGGARRESCGRIAASALYSCGLAAFFLLFGSRALQTAIAEGDTRTLSLHHIHTDEDITVTFKRDGRYDEAALEKLNWFLRDWRRQQQTRMDPHLIDLVWEVHRETGSKEPIWVVCGYRSPETNAMLRRRSGGVARFSQHMLGHAMDFYIPGVPLEQLRVIGLRLQRGGIGFYPTSGSPFVHMDTGSVRHWPRMTHEQLVRVFPDGRTVHIPSDGRPLAGYALALADIRKHGDNPSEVSLEAARNAGINVGDSGVTQRLVNPLARLFGLARNDEDEDAPAAAEPKASASTRLPASVPLRARAKTAIAAAFDQTENKLVAEKNKLAQVAARAEEKLAAGKTKLVQVAAHAEEKLAAERTKLAGAVAKARLVSRAEAAPVAALSPKEIILARGFWQGVPDGMTAVRPEPGPAKSPASSPSQTRAESVHVPQPAHTELAGAASGQTRSVGPFAAPIDRAPAEIALAYAEQPDAGMFAGTARPVTAINLAAPRATINAPVALRGDGEVTIAIKRIDGRPASAILNVANQATVPGLAQDAGFDDPWLRAVFLSPSVNKFLCITALGARDLRALAPLMVKPARSVMLTFAADAQLGLASDHFSGSAIVFVSTVVYPPDALHTAPLH
jgi:uncharacterized protein YcbK (DUF882 family)